MDFILDASFALRWCFEDEATAVSEAVLTQLQNQKDTAWVPDIWPHEMLNGIGKGITRGRIERQKGFLLWQEIRALPIHVVEIPVNEALVELALKYNLAVYDASYSGQLNSTTYPAAAGTIDALANAGYTPDPGYGAGVASRDSQVLKIENCLSQMGALP